MRTASSSTFFALAPESLWPRAVVIEHLSREEWQDDCIADMQSRGYAASRQDSQQYHAGAQLDRERPPLAGTSVCERRYLCQGVSEE